jgi:hypothetical protein
VFVSLFSIFGQINSNMHGRAPGTWDFLITFYPIAKICLQTFFPLVTVVFLFS